MKIYTNLAAMNASRTYNRNQGTVSTAVQRLATGMRINSAVDDAAGLAIGQRMTSQIRGMNVAMRNLNDGLSMLQTAESGLQEIGNMIQRMRELSVQAANTAVVSYGDRRKLQLEVNELLKEVDRIAKDTDFNGVKILNDNVHFAAVDSDQSAVIDALQRGWLEQAEDLVTTYFGLTGSARDLTVDLTGFSDGAGGTLARVTAGVAAGVGNITSLTLQVDMSDVTDLTLPNGGSAPLYADRIIAHEFVHAVRHDNLQSNPTNFNVIFPFDVLTNDAPTQYLSIQAGANKGQTIDIAYAAGSSEALGIQDVDVVNYASVAMGTLDDAIGYIADQRARLGAQMNRLQHAIGINAVNAESLSASRARIEDADYPVETADLTKGMIIAQAATAMLSQAQTAPQLALSLLNQGY